MSHLFRAPNTSLFKEIHADARQMKATKRCAISPALERWRLRRVDRQQVSAFMLKHGRTYPRKKGWTMHYPYWIQEQQFDHPAHQVGLQVVGSERVHRLERTTEQFVSAWSLEPLMRVLQTLRGIDLIVAATFATDVGDVSHFESPRHLMAYLRLVRDRTGVTASLGPTVCEPIPPWGRLM